MGGAASAMCAPTLGDRLGALGGPVQYACEQLLAAAAAATPAGSRLGVLDCVDLSGCPLARQGTEPTDVLALTLSEFNSPLAQLSLRGCGIGSRELATLAAALGGGALAQVAHLDLGHNPLHSAWRPAAARAGGASGGVGGVGGGDDDADAHGLEGLAAVLEWEAGGARCPAAARASRTWT